MTTGRILLVLQEFEFIFKIFCEVNGNFQLSTKFNPNWSLFEKSRSPISRKLYALRLVDFFIMCLRSEIGSKRLSQLSLNDNCEISDPVKVAFNYSEGSLHHRDRLTFRCMRTLSLSIHIAKNDQIYY